MFAATFLCSGDRQARIKLNSRGRKDNHPEEVKIISVKDVPHGFSNKVSSPSLISEVFLFINYLSVSSITSFVPLKQAKSNFG